MEEAQAHGSVRSGPNRFRENLESSRGRIVNGGRNGFRIDLNEERDPSVRLPHSRKDGDRRFPTDSPDKPTLPLLRLG